MNADTATSVTLCIVAVLPTPELRASAFLARAHPHGGSAVRAILTVTRTAIQLPAPRIPRPVDAVALDRYRAALHRAIDDRKIDVEEACELGELIRSDGLTRAAVEQVHRELLEGHRLDVHSDGIITWQEADALSKIARLVGLPEQVAAEEELGRQDKATRRALAEWRVVGIGLDDDVAEVLISRLTTRQPRNVHQRPHPVGRRQRRRSGAAAGAPRGGQRQARPEPR